MYHMTVALPFNHMEYEQHCSRPSSHDVVLSGKPTAHPSNRSYFPRPQPLFKILWNVPIVSAFTTIPGTRHSLCKNITQYGISAILSPTSLLNIQLISFQGGYPLIGTASSAIFLFSPLWCMFQSTRCHLASRITTFWTHSRKDFWSPPGVSPANARRYPSKPWISWISMETHTAHSIPGILPPGPFKYKLYISTVILNWH